MFRPVFLSGATPVLPDPLHPAIVHFPVVLAFILPVFVGGAVWAISRGASVRRAWMVPLVGAVVLALSAWAAVETGGAAGERVEHVVPEQRIESHEQMAEAFLAATIGLAIVALGGLARGRAGRVARVVTGIGALALVGMVVRVGHSGGQLVYRYGAAAAYTSPSGAAPATSASNESAGRQAGEQHNDRDER